MALKFNKILLELLDVEFMRWPNPDEKTFDKVDSFRSSGWVFHS